MEGPLSCNPAVSDEAVIWPLGQGERQGGWSAAKRAGQLFTARRAKTPAFP